MGRVIHLIHLNHWVTKCSLIKFGVCFCYFSSSFFSLSLSPLFSFAHSAFLCAMWAHCCFIFEMPAAWFTMANWHRWRLSNNGDATRRVNRIVFIKNIKKSRQKGAFGRLCRCCCHPVVPRALAHTRTPAKKKIQNKIDWYCCCANKWWWLRCFSAVLSSSSSSMASSGIGGKYLFTILFFFPRCRTHSGAAYYPNFWTSDRQRWQCGMAC